MSNTLRQSTVVYTSTTIITLCDRNNYTNNYVITEQWEPNIPQPTHRQCVANGLAKIPNLDYTTITNTIVTMTASVVSKSGVLNVFIEALSD